MTAKLEPAAEQAAFTDPADGPDVSFDDDGPKVVFSTTRTLVTVDEDALTGLSDGNEDLKPLADGEVTGNYKSQFAGTLTAAPAQIVSQGLRPSLSESSPEV